MRTIAALLLAAAAVLNGATACAAETSQRIFVFAAASLTDAVTEVGAAFTRESGIPITPSFAASSALARQIDSGAPAGVFFSADEEWMDYLQRKGLLAAGTRRDVLANRLALIVPAASKATARITSGPALLAALGDSRIATGDPDSVPAGKYAKAALMKLGVWDEVGPRLIRAENVRVALAYVARGEAQFGIVYQTDAMIEKDVRLLDTFPEDSHEPIRYPIAVTVKGDANAQRFVDFVASEPAAAIFMKYGFSLAR